MAFTNLRTRLTSGGTTFSVNNGGRPTVSNNGAVINGLTPINNTFENGTYQATLLAAGATEPGRAFDPTNPSRTGVGI